LRQRFGEIPKIDRVKPNDLNQKEAENIATAAEGLLYGAGIAD